MSSPNFSHTRYRHPSEPLPETVVLRVNRVDSKRERVCFGDRPIGDVEHCGAMFIAWADGKGGKTTSLGCFCDRLAAIAQLVVTAQPFTVRRR